MATNTVYVYLQEMLIEGGEKKARRRMDGNADIPHLHTQKIPSACQNRGLFFIYENHTLPPLPTSPK
jgi:hypothetical protein